MIIFFLSVSVYLSMFLCSCWSKRWWSRSSWGVRPTWTWPRTPVTRPWLSTLASPRWNVWLSPTSTCPKSLWLGTSLPTLCCTKVKRFSPRKDWKIRIAGFRVLCSAAASEKRTESELCRGITLPVSFRPYRCLSHHIFLMPILSFVLVVVINGCISHLP